MARLYRHFDKDGALLYVGISCNAITRLKQHEHDSGWAAEIARVDIEHFASREEALAAERAAIKNERPKHNVVHNRSGECAARQPRVYEFKEGRTAHQFSSLEEVARFLHSRALAAERGHLAPEQCAKLLRWCKDVWPARWLQTTSHLSARGILATGCVRKLLKDGTTESLEGAAEMSGAAS